MRSTMRRRPCPLGLLPGRQPAEPSRKSPLFTCGLRRNEHAMPHAFSDSRKPSSIQLEGLSRTTSTTPPRRPNEGARSFLPFFRSGSRAHLHPAPTRREPTTRSVLWLSSPMTFRGARWRASKRRARRPQWRAISARCRPPRRLRSRRPGRHRRGPTCRASDAAQMDDGPRGRHEPNGVRRSAKRPPSGARKWLGSSCREASGPPVARPVGSADQRTDV